MTENVFSILIVFFPYNSNKPRSQTETCVFSNVESGDASGSTLACG